jgi:A/G-specific adenine glycosylase
MPTRMDDTPGKQKKPPRKLSQQSIKRPEAAAIRRQLLLWYEGQRRDLPWRQTSDPYRIWTSEVMLQQTRVQAVVPYYKKFVLQFPNVRQLAKAPERTLLACWSGLGYYSRARNLQKAARRMVAEHGGQFPRNLAAALALPGVGEYTAAAVLSIAYGEPLPVVDGNVVRVLARLYGVRADPKTAGGKRLFQRLAGGLITSRRPGDFNQAMMELGATVCLPQQPQCNRCPVRRNCVAYRRSEVERYPFARRKLKPVLQRYTAAVVKDRAGRLLLVPRPNEEKWLAGFWELPMWEPGRSAPPLGLSLEQRLGTVRHSITDNRLVISVFGASVGALGSSPKRRWIAKEDFENIPITTITRKALVLAKIL